MVPVLVLLFVALWFILRWDLFDVLPCVILFLWFSVLLALRLSHLGKRELILVLFVHLFDLCLFGFVGFLFLLVSGKGYGLWHTLDFSLTFFLYRVKIAKWSLSLSLSLSPVLYITIATIHIYIVHYCMTQEMTCLSFKLTVWHITCCKIDTHETERIKYCLT